MGMNEWNGTGCRCNEWNVTIRWTASMNGEVKELDRECGEQQTNAEQM